VSTSASNGSLSGPRSTIVPVTTQQRRSPSRSSRWRYVVICRQTHSVNVRSRHHDGGWSGLTERPGSRSPLSWSTLQSDPSRSGPAENRTYTGLGDDVTKETSASTDAMTTASCGPLPWTSPTAAPVPSPSARNPWPSGGRGRSPYGLHPDLRCSTPTAGTTAPFGGSVACHRRVSRCPGGLRGAVRTSLSDLRRSAGAVSWVHEQTSL
jgi:hypothetical protein